jgi:hypothetical protein
MVLASLNKDINVQPHTSEDCFLAAEAEVSALNGYTLDATTEYPPHYWNGTRWVSGGLNFTLRVPDPDQDHSHHEHSHVDPTRLGGTTLKTDFLLVVSGEQEGLSHADPDPDRPPSGQACLNRTAAPRGRPTWSPPLALQPLVVAETEGP